MVILVRPGMDSSVFTNIRNDRELRHVIKMEALPSLKCLASGIEAFRYSAASGLTRTIIIG